MVYGGALPWWPWLSLEAPPLRRPAALLPGPAGRVCPAASTKLSYLSGCTWAWSHMSHPGHQSLDCWPRPKIDRRRRRIWRVLGLSWSHSPRLHRGLGGKEVWMRNSLGQGCVYDEHLTSFMSHCLCFMLMSRSLVSSRISSRVRKCVSPFWCLVFG